MKERERKRREEACEQSWKMGQQPKRSQQDAEAEELDEEDTQHRVKA